MPAAMPLARIAPFIALLVGLAAAGSAQPAPGRGQPPPQVASPEVTPDRHIVFRLLAPQAESVRVSAGDVPNLGRGAEMTKGDNGVWEATIGPIDPGAYRYTFNVGGVPVVDPRNPSVSESNNTVWSLVTVPGADFMDTKSVPHGAVAAVTYYSSSLSRFRRMHVYTPPGYDLGKGRYPVFYLLHGAGDSDDSWTSVGRAGFILDNLIAAGKAKPMIVVMPAGHTSVGARFAPPRAGGTAPVDEFTRDFTVDIEPYVEKSYRVIADRQHRAIAGLSMGGSQTLNIAIPHLDRYGYVGVFSSGLFGIVGPPRPGGGATVSQAPFAWEEEHRAELDNAAEKRGLRLIWFGTGKDDFLLNTSLATVEMLKRHGFEPVFEESAGGHTWINWRQYLEGFAPKLFQ